MKNIIIPRVGDWVIAMPEDLPLECDSPMRVLKVDLNKKTFTYEYFAEPDDDNGVNGVFNECIGEDEMKLSQIVRIETDPMKIDQWNTWLQKEATLF